MYILCKNRPAQNIRLYMKLRDMHTNVSAFSAMLRVDAGGE